MVMDYFVNKLVRSVFRSPQFRCAPFGKALFLNHDAKVQHPARAMADYWLL